jgi:hypothetical protein
MLFRSGSSDEDGGYPANIAASGASNRTERERTRFLSANNDEVGESIARCASRASKNIVKNETATIRGRGVVV